MCELGSQGGIDGQWHCSAAQVEILLFQHADTLFFVLSFSLSSLCPLFCIKFFTAFCCVSLTACLIKRVSKGRHRRRKRWRGAIEMAKYFSHASF